MGAVIFSRLRSVIGRGQVRVTSLGSGTNNDLALMVLIERLVSGLDM